MKNSILIVIGLLMFLQACSQEQTTKNSNPVNTTTSKKKNEGNEVFKIADYIAEEDYSDFGVATFAGGCFWCTEAAFERIEGVVDVISGYAGGEELYPTYRQIGTGRTGHTESIQIYYDKEKINFEKLLEVFFVAHDPTTLNRQGPDRGPQYRSAIFYHSDEQKSAIDAIIKKLDASGKFRNPIVTEVAPYTEFWTAEGYHQDYYEFHPENPYVQSISRPKVEKVKRVFADILKENYKK